MCSQHLPKNLIEVSGVHDMRSEAPQVGRHSKRRIISGQSFEKYRGAEHH